ncbi:hypothetical protein V1286_001122 [Bradyrhizobium algeriense]|uniref:Uncharacterized protein n=1 Tax=Bradyrhizobium algeriense TaxID=634784 RepID=A0ABU8B4Z4_9BRAD
MVTGTCYVVVRPLRATLSRGGGSWQSRTVDTSGTSRFPNRWIMFPGESGNFFVAIELK